MRQSLKKTPTQLLTFYRICRYNSVLFSYFENRGNCLIRYYTLKPHTNVMSSHHFREIERRKAKEKRKNPYILDLDNSFLCKALFRKRINTA